MIHLDTSALIAALTGDRVALPTLRRLVTDEVRLGVCSIVLYEWWRGPRADDELADQERLVPSSAAVPFGPAEAQVAAEIYLQLSRPRPRAADIAIAACAITQGAALWTLNPADFRDIPGLELAGS
jgi:predicted nucleic acid-binding protein